MSTSHPEHWAEIDVHSAGPREAVVIKPAGLSVELPEDARPGGPRRSLLAWARGQWPGQSPRLVHRLDRLARGIVLVALDQEAAALHAAALRERRWVKLYLARLSLSGAPPPLGVHQVHLRTRGRRAEIVRSGGSPARLELLRLASIPSLASSGGSGLAQVPRGSQRASDPRNESRSPQREMHALIRLETGRFHQIRATLAHLGAPISGDPLYDPAMASSAIGSSSGGSPPYLDHALLAFPPLSHADGGRRQVIWRPQDAAREVIDQTLLDELSRLALQL
jgi:23S rRNA-/tRNA-specific pseudouridylate synthase